MKSFATLAAVAALASFTEAKKCQNITVPVTISARNGVFDQTALTPENDIEVTNIILGLAQQGNNYTADQLQGYATVSGSYNLAATYCAPDSGAPKTVQLLTHGIGKSHIVLGFLNEADVCLFRFRPKVCPNHPFQRVNDAYRLNNSDT